MKRQKRKFEKPMQPFNKERIEREKGILNQYGLRRKQEIWRAESIIRNLRKRARELAAKKDKKDEEVLIKKLNDLSLISKEARVEDILTLNIENILDRRLQTIVFKKGIANSLKHARQMIVHGLIAVDSRRAKQPSMLLTSEQESKLSLYKK